MYQQIDHERTCERKNQVDEVQLAALRNIDRTTLCRACGLNALQFKPLADIAP